MQKILILGSAGSGKSYLGNILAKKLKIKPYDLDDIHYKRKFDIARTKTEKRKMLNRLTRKKSWIITGVRYSWIDIVPKRADKIIILQRHAIIESYRIIKRFLKRRYGPRPPQETYKNMYDLLMWNYHAFHTRTGTHVERHNNIIKAHRKKTITIHSAKELHEFYKELDVIKEQE